MRWKKYPKYKDSGVEWIGEIPEGWEVIKLAFTGHFSKGGGISRADLTDEGYPAILYGDIYTKYDIQAFEIVNHISEAAVSNAVAINRGKLLFTGSGETVEDIGKTIVYMGEKTAYVGGDVIIYSPNNQNIKFLSYSLNSSNSQYQKSRNAKGYTVIHIYPSNLKNILITVPDEFEQAQIASFLDHETSRIDNLIEKKLRQIELLKEKRSALITHAVTKGLNPNVKMKDSGVGWIGEIPEHWEIKSLRYLIKKNGIVRGPFGSSLRIEFFINDGYKVYEQKNAIYKDIELGDYYIDEQKFLELKRFSLNHGDIIMSCSGTIGKMFRVPQNFKEGIINQALMKISLSKIINSDFFIMVFESIPYQNAIIDNSQGGAITNIVGVHIFKSIKILLPPLSEQLEIVSFLNKETSKIDTLISKIQFSINKLKEYRTALISAAVTGKIDVRDWKKEGVS